MGFEIDDNKVLLVSGIAAGAYAAHALACPKNYLETYMEKDQPVSEPMARWFGMALGCNVAKDIVISTRDHDKKAVKDLLKVSGAGWAAASAMSIYNAQEGIQKKELTYGGAAAQAAMAAICLWRGFREDDDDAK